MPCEGRLVNKIILARNEHVIDIFTSEDMENILLCIFRYLTAYHIIKKITSPDGRRIRRIRPRSRIMIRCAEAR